MNLAGAPEAAIRVARELKRRGYDAEIFFLYRKVELHQGEPDIHVLLPATTPGVVGYCKIALRLLQALRMKKPVAVISFLPLANVLGQSVARLVRVKHRVASQRSPYRTFSFLMRLADKVAGTIGIYGEIVAVSKAVQRSFAGHPAEYRRRISVVHNGMTWTSSMLSRENARLKFQLPLDSPVILTVGRLAPQKNYAFQLRMIARLAEVHLAVAGDGPQRADLEKLIISLKIGHRVRLLGNVQQAEMPDLYRAADLFIQPSLFEGHSNALLEAMNEGLPIVASDMPEQVEALTDENGRATGVLLPLDDGIWAEAIRALLCNEEERDELGRRARERSLAFSLDRMVDGFERLLPTPCEPHR